MTDLALLGLSAIATVAMFLVMRCEEDETEETSETTDVDAFRRRHNHAQPAWTFGSLL